MSENMADGKVHLSESSRKTSSAYYKVKIPNFFTSSEFDNTRFEITRPSFEFNDATWKFLFECLEEVDTETGVSAKVFITRLIMLYSKVEHVVLCSISMLDDEDMEYGAETSVCTFKEANEEHFVSFIDNKKSSYDMRNSVTVNIHLVNLKLLRGYEKIVRNLELSEDFLVKGSHDLTLRVPGKEFEVHRHILMSRSNVLKAMLSHDMMEKNKAVIDVPDSDPETMEQFLFYVYSGKVGTWNVDTAIGLYYLSDKYNMILLKEKCTRFMQKSLSTSIICDVLQLALNHGDRRLLNTAIDYITINGHEVFDSAEWNAFMESSPIVAGELKDLSESFWGRYVFM